MTNQDEWQITLKYNKKAQRTLNYLYITNSLNYPQPYFRQTFTIGPEKTINGSSVYTIHMELREGDLAKNQNIRSSRGAASYSLTFEMVLPGGL